MTDPAKILTDQKLQIEKLEAARRQLDTAIELWFFEKDEVSIHALSYAAYEIIHVVSNSRNRSRDLLFDSALVKEEYRSEFNKMLKSHANFFKHAKKEKDVDSKIEFPPGLSEGFILFSILGLELSGEKLTDIESAFMWWIYLHKPSFVTEAGKKFITDNVSMDNVNLIKQLNKSDFFQTFIAAKKDLAAKR